MAMYPITTPTSAKFKVCDDPIGIDHLIVIALMVSTNAGSSRLSEADVLFPEYAFFLVA